MSIDDLAELKLALALGKTAELDNGDIDKNGDISVGDLAKLKLMLAGIE